MYLKSFFGDAPSPHPCASCNGEDLLDFEVRMAFQPIVDARDRSLFAYEALVRGEGGEPAGTVIARLRPEQLYRFDQTCRVKAIETAAKLDMQVALSINIIPNAVYQPATCIRLTLAAAERCGFDPQRLIFELTESERMRDTAHVVGIVKDYQRRGFRTAIDDFGAGYSGLSLLVGFQPDLVKLDMHLIRGLDGDAVRREVVRGILGICASLGCRALAEGVETAGEYRVLRGMGVELFQGYLFARPALEALPQVPTEVWEEIDGGASQSAADAART